MRSILNPLHMETMSYSFGWRGLPIVAIVLAAASIGLSVTGSSFAFGLIVGAVTVAAILIFAEAAARLHEKHHIRTFLAGKHLVALPPILDIMEARKTLLVDLTMVHPHTHWIEMQFREEVWRWGMQNLHAPFGVVPIRGLAESWRQPVQCYFSTEEDAEAFSRRWLSQ